MPIAIISPELYVSFIVKFIPLIVLDEVLRELGGPFLVEYVYQYLLRHSDDTLIEALSCIFS